MIRELLENTLKDGAAKGLLSDVEGFRNNSPQLLDPINHMLQLAWFKVKSHSIKGHGGDKINSNLFLAWTCLSGLITKYMYLHYT